MRNINDWKTQNFKILNIDGQEANDIDCHVSLFNIKYV